MADVIVIGSGLNGLTTACILARAGRKVVVLERRDVAGGLAAAEEFHPGYRSPGLLHDTAQLRLGVVDALHLAEHGLDLAPPDPVLFPEAKGPGLVISSDEDATVAEIGRRSQRDVKAWKDHRAFVARVRRVIEPLLNDTPPDVAAIGTLHSGSLGTLVKSAMSFRRLGGHDMTELLRIPPMCVADWMNEWFETDLLKAGLAHGALVGLWAGPWSPGTAANLLLSECTETRSVIGGAGALAVSLLRAARQFGVEVQTGAAVASIRIENGVAKGVVLASGETVDAPVVAAACDPRTTFLDLIPPATLPLRIEHRATAMRARGTTAKVHLALDRRLEFASRPGERVARARTATTLDDLERAFDPVKYGRMSERPALDIVVPTVARGDAAPDGCDVVSILAHFAPHNLAGGWTDERRQALGDAVVAELERVAPGVGHAIVGREVLTPLDIEARYGATGGHIHHLEHALDQLVIRPTIETMRYETPIRNLFLCGSGSHPGGGVTCAPGALAAATILSRS